MYTAVLPIPKFRCNTIIQSGTEFTDTRCLTRERPCQVMFVPLNALNVDTVLLADCAPTRSLNLDMRNVSRSSQQHV